MRPPSVDKILAAPRAIDPAFLHTPLLRGTALDAALGVTLALKVETLNPIRSFKGRGTDFLVGELLAAGPAPRMLVCASAGNFGQGLAWAGARRGVPVTVFAAVGANPLKVAAMRALGATVHTAGADFDAAKNAARAFAAEQNDERAETAPNNAGGALYVEDGAWPEIAEGAGTLAAELTEAGERPDVMLVPLGNGALATGVGAWLRHASPATRVVGVVAAGAPSMQRSFAERRAVPTARADTIADGIAVREPVPYAVACMADTVDEVVEVDDDAIRAAMRLAHTHVGLVVEPAGAAGLAALVADPARWRGARAASPLCGGNVTPEQARAWLCA